MDRQQMPECLLKRLITLFCVFISLFSRTTIHSESILPKESTQINTNTTIILSEVNNFLQQNHIDKAIDLLQKSLELNPADTQLRFRLARLFAWSSRLKSAESNYLQILKSYPEDIDVKIGLAQCLYWSSRFLEAQQLIESILEKNPENLSAQILLLRVNAAQGHRLASYINAVELDKKTENKDPELGLLIASLCPYELSSNIVDLLSRPTQDGDILLRQKVAIANLLIRSGQPSKGIILFSNFYYSSPPDYKAAIEFANLLASIGDLNTAKDLYLQASKFNTSHQEALLGLARLASREGRLSESLEIFNTVAEENPENLDSWLGVLRISLMLKDHLSASNAIAKIHALSPKSSVYFTELLKLQLIQCQYENAIQTVINWLNNQPDDLNAKFWELLLSPAELLEKSKLCTLLDPFNPEITASVLKLADDPELANSVIAKAQNLPPYIKTSLIFEISKQSAMLLDAKSLNSFICQLPTNKATLCRILYSGHKTYLSKPFTLEDDLSIHLDKQAIYNWLINQTDSRLRNLYNESGTMLLNFWITAKAKWYSKISKRSDTLPDYSLLYKNLLELINPCLKSEFQKYLTDAFQPPPQEFAFIKNNQARWCFYNFNFAETVELLASSQTNLNLEDLLLLINAYTASGDSQKAIETLEKLDANNQLSPQLRLQLIELLIKNKFYERAEIQLDKLRSEGFNEPEYYLAKSRLLLAKNQVYDSMKIISDNLYKFKNPDSLLAHYIESLIKQNKSEELTRLLADYPAGRHLTPEVLSAISSQANIPEIDQILNSPDWIFSDYRLQWQRLREKSINLVINKVIGLLNSGNINEAVALFDNTTKSNIPDSDFWFLAGRTYFLTGDYQKAEKAYTIAYLLGCGRPDALLAMRHSDAKISGSTDFIRTLTSELDKHPQNRAYRTTLVLILLSEGKINQANRMLYPLVEQDPTDPEVRLLEAQIKAAEQQVAYARSLYSSILRNDPTLLDARAGLTALKLANQYGLASGYEYSFLNDTSGAGQNLPDWQEFYLNAWTKAKHQQVYTFEYRWLNRFGKTASQVYGLLSKGINNNWIVRANLGKSICGDFIANWRGGFGLSYKITPDLFAGTDLNYIDFDDVNVKQVIPSITYRWHPKWTSEIRFYLSNTEFNGSSDSFGLTTYFDLGWQWKEQSGIKLFFAIGDENAADLTRDLVTEQQFSAVGIILRLGFKNKWQLEPLWRYESHKNFYSHTIGLSLKYAH